MAFALTAAYSAFFGHEKRVMTERSDTIFGSQELLLAMSANSSPPEVKPTILMWTTYFGSRPTNLLDECPPQEQCRLTYDRSLSETAAAVVFHLQVR